MNQFPIAFTAFALLSAAAMPAGAADFRFTEGAGYMDLHLGDKPVYRHVTAWDPKKHGETFKTFHHVYGFHGDGFLTKGPGGQFTHHRGLFMGWSQTSTGGKTMDSWHGGNGSSTRHVKYLPERELIGATARRASVTEWTMQDNSVIVRDTREVTARVPQDGMLFLDWTMTIASATEHAVTLNGDPQHAGFQFRADSLITTFEYLGPADKTGTGDVWTMKNTNSWAVNKFALKGHGYAVMQMDHPRNPRPVVVSHRDYGRFGHYFTAEIPADKPLTFYFRTLVLDTDKFGAPTVASAQALYDEYARLDPSSGGTAGIPLLTHSGNSRKSGLRLIRNQSGAWNGAERMGLQGAERFGVEGRRSPAGTWLAPGLSILRVQAP